jgi:hypothetical protein
MKTFAAIVALIVAITLPVFADTGNDKPLIGDSGKQKLTVTSHNDGTIKMDVIFSSADEFDKFKKSLEAFQPKQSVNDCDHYCVTCTNPNSNKYGHHESVCTGGWFIGPFYRALLICGVDFQIVAGDCK